MKRLLVLGAVCAAAGAVHAQTQIQAQGQPAVPQGYVFDRPALLADQLVWGVVHGARLLAHACSRAGHGAAAEAWVDWLEREAAQIERIGKELSRHYFETDDVAPDVLAAALGLKQALALPAEELEPACASLPEALAQPRYDLQQRREALIEKYRQ